MTTFIKGSLKKFHIYLIMICVAFSLSPAFVSAGDYVKTSKPVASYASDGMIDVSNTVTYTGKISAFALKVSLPDNVEFVSTSADSQPAIKPKAGDTGLLEFLWVTPPTSPFVFNYSVLAAKEATGDIEAVVVYRRDGGAKTVLIPNVNVK